MKTITETVEMYLYARKSFDNGATIYEWVACSMDGITGYILVATKEFELSIALPDDFDLTQAEIDTLQAAKEKIQAETHLKVQNIEDQIQRLLAIGHD